MNKVFTFLRESSTARFLVPMGLVLIIFGAFLFVVNKNNQDYVETKATVVNVIQTSEAYVDVNGDQVDATYSATIKYTVNQQEYTNTLDNVSKYEVGSKITIYYNPKNPNEITQVKSLILPIAIILAGIAALTGGIVSGVNAVKRYQKMKDQEKGWENGQ